MYKLFVSAFLKLVFIALFCHPAFGNAVKLQSHSKDDSLPHKLLLEALARADLSYTHPYENEINVSGARVNNDLKTGGLDVMWSMTSQQLEDEFQALYFPLFRGLLGMRVALIKAENRDLFVNVRNIEDLKRFSAGQGKTWPDTQILEANALNVVKILKYPNLFFMLEGGRFDYYPRGLNEPWAEIERHEALNLVVDSHVMLKYRAPLYFFVNKQNQQLAEQLSNVLDEMVRDGTFSQLFFDDVQVQSALTKANVQNRVIIELDNPQLSDNTPVGRKELWFDPLTDIAN